MVSLKELPRGKGVKNMPTTIDGKTASDWWNIGVVEGELGNYQKAVEYYEKAVTIDPHYTEAWYNMGVNYKKLGNYRKVIECWQKTIQFNPMLSAFILPKLRELQDQLEKEEDNPLDITDPYKFFNSLGKRCYLKYHISRNSDFSEITDIWRRLVKFLHPDQNPYASEEITKKLNEAYQKIKKQRNL